VTPLFLESWAWHYGPELAGGVLGGLVASLAAWIVSRRLIGYEQRLEKERSLEVERRQRQSTAWDALYAELLHITREDLQSEYRYPFDNIWRLHAERVGASIEPNIVGSAHFFYIPDCVKREVYRFDAALEDVCKFWTTATNTVPTLRIAAVLAGGQTGLSPLLDAQLRRAIEHSIDRQQDLASTLDDFNKARNF
jgi:hypothetical protein